MAQSGFGLRVKAGGGGEGLGRGHLRAPPTSLKRLKP